MRLRFIVTPSHVDHFQPRDRVAKAVEDEDTPARDLAALTRRLLEIAKDIDVLEAAAKKAERDNETATDERFDASAV